MIMPSPTSSAKIPIINTIRIGLMLKEVIPSTASVNILEREYFDAPCILGNTSKCTTEDFSPISGIMPRRNRLTYPYYDSAVSAFLLMRR